MVNLFTAAAGITLGTLGTPAAAAGTCCAASSAATAAAAAAAPAGDFMYTFAVTGDGDKSSGTVRAHDGVTRIDTPRQNHSDDYILLTEGGTRMLSVHPDRREVDEISSPTFEHIIGTALRTVSPLVKFTVDNSKVSFERVGTGQKLLGYATEQMRVTESFDVHIRAMGFDGGTEHHTVVTDYWVSPGLDFGDNPVLALIEHAATATAQTDQAFVRQEADVRARAVHGTPLRTVVHETEVDDDGHSHKVKQKTQTIEITSIHMGAQPAALFQVPSGYRIRSGVNIDM